MPLTDKEKAKRYREKRKLMGLCSHCGCLKKPLEGHTRCAEHLLAHNKDSKRRYDERKSDGICRDCGEKVSHGFVLCASCNYENTRRVKRRYVESRTHILKYQKNRRLVFIEQNKCARCGMPLNEESRMGKECLTCYSKYNGGY
jgi:hypothetical protein